MPLQKPAWGTQSPEVEKRNTSQDPITKEQNKTSSVNNQSMAHDQPGIPQEKLRRIVEAEHIVIVFHVILVQQSVQLLQLKDRKSVLSKVLRAPC